MKQAIIIHEPETVLADHVFYILKKEGIDVAGVACGMKEGLITLRDTGKYFDIIILDVHLPMMILQDIADDGHSIIFYSARNNSVKFATFRELTASGKTTEIRDLLSRLNQQFQWLEENATSEENVHSKLTRIPISTPNEIIFLPLTKVTYFEAHSNYTCIHSDDGKKFISSRNIGHYEKMLDEETFCRCHHSYLINVSKVTRFIKGKTGYVEIDHNIMLEVSARKKNQLMKLLGVPV